MADGTPFHLAEHLSLLAKHGKGLLVGFHNLHRMLANCGSQQKPSPGTSAEYNATKDAIGSEPNYRLFTDSSLTSVVKLLVKRFPDPTDASKATGFETFSRFQREISNELQSPYQLMVDFYEFHEVCLAVFQQIEKTEGLTLANTPDIFLDYLRLTSIFISCHILFGQVGTERKSIAAAFSKAYTLVNGIPEPSFKRLSIFLSNFDRPFHIVQEELHLIPPGKLSTALASLRTELEVGPLTPAEILRKMSVLSLVNTTTGGVRAGETRIESAWLRSLTNIDTYLSAVVIGFMACPAELLKLVNGQETLKLALGDGICTPLVRSEMLAVFSEYEAVSKINSKYKKITNIVSDGTANFAHAAALHRDRREYLRHQLRQIYSLCSHNPQIMASLFTVVCAALSLAVHEITWYFANLERSATVAKKATGSKKDVKVLDATITEIIWFTESIRRLAAREKDGIQSYFYQQLTLHAGSQLQPLLFSMRNAVPAISESVIQIIDGTINLLNEVPPAETTEQTKTKLPSLEGIRVNWARIQVCLTMPQTIIHPEKVEIISTTMSEMSVMSKYIDTFDEHLDSVGSLKGLFYYRYALLEHLNDTLENYTDQLRYVDVYLALAEEFPKNASPYWSSELEWLGQQSAMFAQEALSRISKKAADVFYDVVLTCVSYGKQFTPDYLAAVLADKQNQKKSGSPKKSAQTQVSLPPGWESHLGSGSEVVAAGLYTQKTALNNLWRAISSQDEFFVHDRILSPREYFTDAFGELARKWFSSNAFLDVDGHTTKEASNLLPDEVLPYRLKRPSYYLNELRSFLSAMQIADAALKLDFSGAIADLMKEQLDATACRKLYDAQPDQVIYRPAKQKSRRTNEGLPKANALQPILLTYTTWYVDMVANKATTGGVCYSPARQGLVSRSQLEFKAEEYTDFCELTALCQILGAEGIRFMDERLMKVVTVMASGIKDAIVENAEMLKVLQQHWRNFSRTEGILLKLHGIDEFVTKSTVLGVAAEFRKLLLGALEMELKAKTPVLWSTLYHLDSETVKQNPASEELIHRSGIIAPSDPAARAALLLLCNNLSTDREMWSFLPYIFAAGIWYMAYSGPSLYNPWLEVLENNTHCIAAAFDLLTVTVSNILSPGDTSLAEMMQLEFLKVASTFLLRLKATAPDKDGLPREIESLYYIIRRVGDNSTVLTRESIEYGHPYTILKLTMGENFRCRFTVNQKGKRVVTGSLLYSKGPGVDEETGY